MRDFVPQLKLKYGTALGHDWQKSEDVIYCTVKKSQKYKYSRCTEEKEEFANAYVAGDNIPEVHKSLSVGGTCIHCGGEVLAKNGDSLVIKLGDIFQTESGNYWHYDENDDIAVW